MSNIDVDSHTLHRLSSKAFNFDTEEKERYREEFLRLLQNEHLDIALDMIIEFIEDEYKSREILFATGTVNPKSILKPKGRIFRRVKMPGE